jgi:hypothetical protein
MVAQTKTSLHRLLVTIGLALVAVVLLLSWTAAKESGVQALSHEPGDKQPEKWRDFRVAWASMNVTHTPIVTKAGYVWSIDENDITITFQQNTVFGPGDPKAVFTFTPLSGYEFPPPLLGSYVFQLEGQYDWGGSISVGTPYSIALHYQVSSLNGASEDSLQFYYQYIESSPPMTRWVPVENSTVHPEQNLIECSTNETGAFAVGGYAFQTYIPFVLKNRHY